MRKADNPKKLRVRIELVREYVGQYYGKIEGPASVVAMVPDLQFSDREQVAVIYLSTPNQVLGVNICSSGTLTASMVHPREVFKPAILANSARIILVHNHPSGDCSPSSEDCKVTERIKKAGALLGIELLDHVIVSASGYYSMQELGLIDKL